MRRAPAVISVGPLPPPLHGASIVHDLVVSMLRRDGASVRVIDTAAAGRSGARYHLARVSAHLRAMAVLLRAGALRRRVGVYLTGAGGAGIWYQVPLAALSRLFGYSLVYHHHSFAYIHSPALAMRALVAAGGARARHVTLCEDMRAGLVRRYPGVRTSAVCSNSALLPQDRPDDETEPTPEIHLGHLGNLNTDKGLAVVLAAHAGARSAGHATHLHLAGPAVDRQTSLTLQVALGGDHSVTYHGPLTREDVGAFLRRLDVFLFPSRYAHEAEPLVVLEALAAGVPVLAFGVGCLSAAFRGTRWLAADEPAFHTQLEDVLGELQRLGSPAARRGYLRAAAAELSGGFGAADIGVVVAGLGLTAEDAGSARTGTTRRLSHRA